MASALAFARLVVRTALFHAPDPTNEPVITGGHCLFETLDREQQQLMLLVAVLQFRSQHEDLVVLEAQIGFEHVGF